jgi:hypothetical protein
MKALRRDANDREGIRVEADRLSDNLRVCAETPLPEVETDHRDGAPARRLIILFRQQPPKQWIHAQRGKEIARHYFAQHALRLAAAAQTHLQTGAGEYV